MRLELNENRTVVWEDIGDGEVLVVDDAFKNPEQLREHALTLRYDYPNTKDQYPGIKAFTLLPGAEQLTTELAKLFLDRLWGKERPSALSLAAARPSGQVFAALTIDRERARNEVFDQQVDQIG
jgi:hypothetical protein